MARTYRKSRKGYLARRRRVRKKWRQQKLAVGTVAKIARKVASKLDRQNDKTHLFVLKFLADGQAWPSTILSLPGAADYRPIVAPGLEAKPISDLGGYVQDLTGVNATASQQKGVPIFMQGIQCRFVMQNRTTTSCRVRAMLVYIPNLNYNTDDAVDFLRPDDYMLGKCGTGNLVYDGWNKQNLNINAGNISGYRRYTILDKKTFTLPPTKYSGQQIQSAGISRDVPAVVTKHVTLSKYFKGKGKKHFIKNQAAIGRPLMDGSYWYVIWSDMEFNGASPLSLYYCGVTQLKFKVGATQAPVNG